MLMYSEFLQTESATANTDHLLALSQQAYNIDSVNYNRDIDAFPILANLITGVAGAGSYMHNYRYALCSAYGYGCLEDDICCMLGE